jgi:putative DNA primase/helicase
MTREEYADVNDVPHRGVAFHREDPRPIDSVKLIRADSIAPRAISWVWPGWLAKGKLHILGGAPGTGKTTITLSFASSVSCGGDWPDGSRCGKPGNVVMWSGEDDPADTLVPRLIATGADLGRVHFVGDVIERGKTRAFDPARDIERLRSAIKQAGGADLLIVDPIVSAVSGDSHKNSETRRALQPLVDLASETGAALIGITHLSKGTRGLDPVERLTGSLAFGALARVVMIAVRTVDKDTAKSERALCRAKSNIGPDEGGFAYELRHQEPVPGIHTSSVMFLKAIEGTAREILGEAEAEPEEADNGERNSTVAGDFLITLLVDGKKPVAEIKDAANAHCHPWRTVERAKTKLGVRAVREGFGKGAHWMWEMPCAARSDGVTEVSENLPYSA